MTLRLTSVFRTLAAAFAGLPLRILVLSLFVSQSDSVAVPPAEEPHNAAINRAKRHATIDDIRKFQAEALVAEREQKFDAASKGLDVALKSARQRFPDTHWVVRRIRARQRYVSYLAGLSSKQRIAHGAMESALRFAEAARDAGKADEMMFWTQGALIAFEEVGGRDTCQHSAILKWEITVLFVQRRLREEEQAIKELQGLVAKLHGEGDPDYARSFWELSRNMRTQRKPQEAQKLFERARTLFESDVGRQRARVHRHALQGGIVPPRLV